MVVAAQRLKHKEQLRDSILESARLIVLQEGWQAVSIRKIADSIGYSLPMVYKFFESKDAILEEFIKHGFSMLSKIMRAAQAKYELPSAQLSAMADAYFEFALSQSAYYQLMFGLGIPNCQKAKEVIEIAEFGQAIMATLKPLIVPENSEKTKLKFHTFWSILHGLTSINMVNITATPDQIQKQVLQDAVQGFIRNINY